MLQVSWFLLYWLKAFYVELASKHLKMGTGTIVLALALTFIAGKAGIPGWLLNIAIIAGGILVAQVQYIMEAKRSEPYV